MASGTDTVPGSKEIRAQKGSASHENFSLLAVQKRGAEPSEGDRVRVVKGIGCEWSIDYHPVPGWTIKNSPCDGKEGIRVLDCPKYVKG